MSVIIGDRTALDVYLRRAGRRLAVDIARAIFADEERCAEWEAGLDRENLPPAVEYQLSKLIAARNGHE